jgi:hypothetical protein
MLDEFERAVQAATRDEFGGADQADESRLLLSHHVSPRQESG